MTILAAQEKRKHTRLADKVGIDKKPGGVFLICLNYWRRGRVAEGGGLLNRYTIVKSYPGFESLRLRHLSF